MTAFISANNGKLQIYTTSDMDAAPCFVGSIQEVADYMVARGIQEAMCSSSLDFGTEYGFEVDDLHEMLEEAIDYATLADHMATFAANTKKVA